MLTMVNALLDVSKIDGNPGTLSRHRNDLFALAGGVVRELRPLGDKRGVQLLLPDPLPALPVRVDAFRMQQVVRNLLANAIHHTPVHGRLGVLLRNSTGRRELLVWDEGPGIDDAVRQRLFQPFSAGQGGVGLGLSICRQIAEAMGAQVMLFNRMDGVDAVVAWEG